MIAAISGGPRASQIIEAANRPGPVEPGSLIEAVKALKELSREIRMELARRVKLRHVPELHFHYDDSVDRGERIETLLKENPPSDPEPS